MKKVLWIFLALLVIGGLLIWRVVANLDAIANPDALQYFASRVELTG